ncbi:hypothetical protein GCM10027188_19250 [Lysobacter humi (ex Lee et al. 2017)]
MGIDCSRGADAAGRAGALGSAIEMDAGRKQAAAATASIGRRMDSPLVRTRFTDVVFR